MVAAVREGHRLRKERTGLIAYLIFCAVTLTGIGFGSLLGWFSLALTAILVMSIHLLLLALPLPLWIVGGISHLVYTIGQKA